MVERPSGKERKRKVVKIFFIATRVSWILVSGIEFDRYIDVIYISRDDRDREKLGEEM